LVQYCNRPATVIFAQHYIKKEMHITTTDLRDLLSHSKPIADETITLYLELLTTQYNITYLATNTIPKLQGEGWIAVQRSFASFRNRRRTNARPRMTGEAAIVIPCYVNNCHWVTVVRREVNGQVLFLYADDMNNLRTEQDIKQLLSTRSTSPIFHPPSAKWIVCRNYTYIPHSNECGPRSLVAATLMALHPNPSNYILLPSMHNNLAQISRTWVAISLLKNNIHQPAIQLLCAPSRMTFQRVTKVPSAPFHLIPWTDHSDTPPIELLSGKEVESGITSHRLPIQEGNITRKQGSEDSTHTANRNREDFKEATKPNKCTNTSVDNTSKLHHARDKAPSTRRSSLHPAKRQVQLLPG
jgi:hypothetical protein